jgi:sec-independent protein translocase protein TatC
MQPDLDSDPLASSRMPLGDHLEELRLRLWRAILGYVVAVVLGFLVSRPVFDVITAPIDASLKEFHARRIVAQQRNLDEGDNALLLANAPREVPLEMHAGALRGALGLPARADDEPWVEVPARIRPVSLMLAAGPGYHAVLRPPSLTALTVTEPFLVYFKVSLVLGLVLASPWLVWQFWAFVGAGLYPHERKLVYLFGPLSLGLFLGGVLLCQLVVLPAGVAYLLSYYEWLDVEPDLRLRDWLDVALWTPVVFGLCFQTPLVMLALERLGILSVDTYRNNRRLAIFLLSVLAAVVTVTPDWFNMVALAAPLCLLYEAGIVLCRLAARGDSASEDEEESELEEVWT